MARFGGERDSLIEKLRKCFLSQKITLLYTDLTEHTEENPF